MRHRTEELDPTGDEFRLARPVDRFPQFTIPAGHTVEVVEFAEDVVWARVKAYIPALDEWNNEISWTADEPEGDARLAFLGDVEASYEDQPRLYAYVAADRVLSNKDEPPVEYLNGVLDMVQYMTKHSRDEVARRVGES